MLTRLFTWSIPCRTNTRTSSSFPVSLTVGTCLLMNPFECLWLENCWRKEVQPWSEFVQSFSFCVKTWKTIVCQTELNVLQNFFHICENMWKKKSTELFQKSFRPDFYFFYMFTCLHILNISCKWLKLFFQEFFFSFVKLSDDYSSGEFLNSFFL